MSRTLVRGSLVSLMIAVAFGATAEARTGKKWVSNSGEQTYELELTEEELEERRTSKNSLLNELSDVGKQFDCWFTIERASTPTSKTLTLARFEIDYDIESIDALRDTMKSQLKEAVIRKDAKHPRVLHVIDAALAKDPNYAMDKPATLNYSGVAGDLPDKIGELVSGVGSRRGGGFNTDAFDDHATRVEVDAKEEAVRDLLTNALLIEKYERVLWVAETREQDGKRETWLQFTGPHNTKERSEKK